MAKSPYLQGRSQKEALEAFEHIELTEEELNEAILAAKYRKNEKIQLAEREEKAIKNRKNLTESRWSAEQTEGFMMYRAVNVFKKGFVVNNDNHAVFTLLCKYFSEDQTFVSFAAMAGVQNPSLDKGILLAGNFGVGKTFIMRLFSRNQRQCFDVLNAKDIANEFESDGQEGVDGYVKKTKNPINDASCFYQTYRGLCIDDLGTEDTKNHFGNKKNVIGDLMEQRYAAGNCGVFLHATTNLTAEQMKEFYGGRVISRFREIFNLIELTGEDRRK